MMPTTLARKLAPARVDWDVLKRDYGPMLGLVDELIQVVPECDPFLAIWEPGFRTYNLVVPALFNLPSALFSRGRVKALVGLSAYASSRAAGCMYCSAHTCAFAMKRGASVDAVSGKHDEVEAAVAAIGEAMGKVPSTLTKEHLDALGKHLSATDVQWVAYGAVVMGFLNKFMDVMGVELEAEAISMVKTIIEPTGWTVGKHVSETSIPDQPTAAKVDGVGTYVRVMKNAPGAVRLEWTWTKGVPGDNAGAKKFLEKEVGFAFSIIDAIGPDRVVKAIAATLRDNMDPSKSKLGIEAKCLAALTFARCVSNERLEADAVRLTKTMAPQWGLEVIDEVLGHAGSMEASGLPSSLDTKTKAALALTRAASSSPAIIDDQTVDTVTKELDAEQVIELVVWISVLQMLHRFDIFHHVRATSD